MTVHRLPYAAGEFAQYLTELCGRIDRTDGWYAIFRQRDPDGLRACLDGVEIPPWDVVESLLHDLAAATGAVYAEQEAARARALHTAAATAHDRLEGGHEALRERLELMRREEAYAKSRALELLRLLAAEPERGPGTEHLTHELAWNRDDHARAMARITELTARLDRLRAVRPPDPAWPPGRDAAGAGRPATAGDTVVVADTAGAPSGAGARRAPAGAAAAPHPAGALPDAGQAPGPAREPDRPAPRHPAAPHDPAAPQGLAASGLADRARLAGDAHLGGGAHLAGPTPLVSHAPHEAARHPAAAQAQAPAPAPAREPAAPRGAVGAVGTAVGVPAREAKRAKEAARAAKRPRRGGARFAGVEDDDGGPVAVPLLPVADDTPRGARYGGAPVNGVPVAAPAPDPAGAVQAARETVAALGRLRAEGRGGEAHVVLCEAAARPGTWLPALAAELDRSGLGADRATLLWEVASQPAARVAAAADALALAGRDDDCRLLLRQGVARPAGEIADTVMALEDEGMAPRAGALLAAYVEVRSAEETARVAERDPFRLVPRLLAAARAVSPSRERDLIHALRVAGHLAG